MTREEMIIIYSEKIGEKSDEISKKFSELRDLLINILPEGFKETSVAHMNLDQSELWCSKALIESINEDLK